MRTRDNLTARQALEIIAASPLRRYSEHGKDKDCRTDYPNLPDVWCCCCLAVHTLERLTAAEGEAAHLLARRRNSDWQGDVAAFMRAFGQDVVDSGPAVPADPSTPRLRTELIREEAAELTAALAAGDLTEIADGICDLVYVALGTAVSYGIWLEPIWAAVHEANMAKTGGRKREDGKWIKPADWKPADVAGLLAAQAVPK